MIDRLYSRETARAFKQLISLKAFEELDQMRKKTINVRIESNH